MVAAAQSGSGGDLLARRWLAFAAGAWLVASSSTAQASPLQMFGLGGVSPGRAATGVADSHSFECVYLNPAGLADTDKKRLTLGTLAGTFDLDGVDRTVDEAFGVILGASLRLPLGGVMKDRLGLAMGFYVPSARLNKARAPMPGTPFYALLENRAQTVGIQFGLGVRLAPRWSVGLSVLALAALEGHIHVAADAAGRFTTTSEQQLVTHFAPILGGRWNARDDLDVGL